MFCMPPALAGGFYTTSTTWEAYIYIYIHTHTHIYVCKDTFNLYKDSIKQISLLCYFVCKETEAQETFIKLTKVQIKNFEHGSYILYYSKSHDNIRKLVRKHLLEVRR